MTASLFTSGRRHHQAGDFRQAQELYRQLLQVEPGHAEAWFHLGEVCQVLGQWAEARAAYEHALQLHPDRAAAHHKLGIVLLELRKYPEAACSFQEGLRLDPDSPEAHNNLGIALLEQGQPAEALASFDHALHLKPAFPEALNNQGNALFRQGNLQEAVERYQQALRHRPDYVQAHINLGKALRALGRPEDSVRCYQEALRLNPAHAGAHNEFGLARLDQGRYTEAADCFREAVRLHPGFAEAHNHLGIALLELNQAEAAEASYRQALKLWPAYAEAHYNLGVVRGMRRQLDEAIACYRHAVRLKPDLAGAFNNLGNTYKEQGRLEEAIACYRRAVALRPDDTLLASNLLFALHYHPGYTPEAIFLEHRQWARRLAEPLAPACPPPVADRPSDRRLRLGYVSPDFRAHVMGSYIEAVIAAHDRTRFAIYCYADVARPDAVTGRIRERADQWRSLVGLSDDQAARLIRDDGIDLLVDLAGHTGRHRLLVFARKPAPVQASHFGYADSTGLAFMDYRITDARADPPGLTERYHTETLVRLPDTWWCYPPPVAPEVSALPADQAGHVTFGSFNSLTKITAEMITLWSQILLALPGSRLHVLAGAGRGGDDRVLDALALNGVDCRRVSLLGRRKREEYFPLYHAVDLCLDTFPFTGCNTSADALWMGESAWRGRRASHAKGPAC